jgi:hypothetical protein
MRAITLLQRQFTTINGILHDLADDLTSEELTTRRLPNTNLLAFDLWHVARTQDWAAQTLVRGVPELIDAQEWQGRGQLATHGIGVGLTRPQADDLASSLHLADLLEYADAVHQHLLNWLNTVDDEYLDAEPDVPTHLSRYPIYLGPAMREEVPWMFEHPPVWRCLSPANGHVRDHLAEMDLIKQQVRTH